MLERPVLKRHLQAMVLPDEGVFLTSDHGNHVLTGAPYELLAPYLTGEFTTDEIVSLLAHRQQPSYTYHAIARLERSGFIAEADDLPAADAAFWESLGVNATAAERRVRTTNLSVRILGDVPLAERCVSALTAHGFNMAGRPDLTIVLTPDYLRAELEEANREALRLTTPWLVARPTARIAWLGPLFIPGRTACFECLLHRLRRRLPVEAFLTRRANSAAWRAGRPTTLPCNVDVVAHLIACQIARWAGECRSPLENAIITFDAAQLELRRHEIVRRPQCPACGDVGILAERVRRPIQLEATRPGVLMDGGRRSIGPNVFLRRHAALVSPVTGIAPFLEDVELDAGGVISACVSGPMGGQDEERYEELRPHLRGVNGGKGKNRQQAHASALAEAVERYAGTFQGDEPRIRAAFVELGETAIHPNDVLLISARQYEARQHQPPTARRLNRVPEPFDAERAVDWTPVWSLSREQFRYLPTCLLYYSYPAEAPPFCGADSTGCAAAATMEEAILQGLYELVERDAFAIWWYNRLSRPAVDLGSACNGYFERVADACHRLGRDVWALDLTTDLGIPCFATISRIEEAGDGPERIALGLGAHGDAETALARAVTEMNQFLAAVHDRPAADLEPDVAWWLATARTTEQTYLLPGRDPAISLSQYPRAPDTADVVAEIQRCLRTLQQRGLECLVLDQSRPDIDIAVVRVIVPGLRTCWARFAPGRLYDTPVRLRWTDEALAEEAMNPIAFFL